MEVADTRTVQVENVLIAHHFLKDVVVHTPLQKKRLFIREIRS